MFSWPPLVCAVPLLAEEILLRARRFVVFLSQRNSDKSDFWWPFGARTKETKRVFFLGKGNSSQNYQMNVFGAKGIEPQSTLGYFVSEILTLFSFVFTLAVFCSLSKRPRHCKRKELNTSVFIYTLILIRKMRERLTQDMYEKILALNSPCI